MIQPNVVISFAANNVSALMRKNIAQMYLNVDIKKDSWDTNNTNRLRWG